MGQRRQDRIVAGGEGFSLDRRFGKSARSEDRLDNGKNEARAPPFPVQVKNKIRGSGCVVRCAEDFILVLSKRIKPRSNVGGMACGIVWNTGFSGDENTRQFSA